MHLDRCTCPLSINPFHQSIPKLCPSSKHLQNMTSWKMFSFLPHPTSFPNPTPLKLSSHELENECKSHARFFEWIKKHNKTICLQITSFTTSQKWSKDFGFWEWETLRFPVLVLIFSPRAMPPGVEFQQSTATGNNMSSYQVR